MKTSKKNNLSANKSSANNSGIMIKRILNQQHPANLFRLNPTKTSIIKQKIETFYAPTIGEQLVNLTLYNTTLFFPGYQF